MTTAFRPAYLPLSTSTSLPDFIIFPISTRYYNFSVNNNIIRTSTVHKQPEKEEDMQSAQ